MKILILGGSGFIGLNLAKQLNAKLKVDDQLILADNFSRGKDDSDFNEFLKQFPAIKLFDCDLTRAESFDVFEGVFDYVYLLASMVGVRNCELYPERVIQTNTNIILNTLNWMIKSSSKKIFFSSTSENYAGAYDFDILEIPTPENVPLVITDIKNPRFSYAITKIWGEAAVTFYGQKYGFKTVIGRYHNVYGPRMGYDHVIPQLFKQLFSEPNVLKVMNPEHTRSFCYVSDAVKATIMLMEIDKTDIIVHIGDGRVETKIEDLAKKMIKIVGSNIELESAPAPVGSVSRRLPNTELLQSLTGFEPSVTLEKGLEETYLWYSKHK